MLIKLGYTALMREAQRGNVYTVPVLINAGANREIQNKVGVLVKLNKK